MLKHLTLSLLDATDITHAISTDQYQPSHLVQFCFALQLEHILIISLTVMTGVVQSLYC
jgi:hypothetical protein